MKCNLCHLGESSDKQCLPDGTYQPLIYMVGEAPGPEEDKAGTPFIGPAGQLLRQYMQSLDLGTYNCRLFNVVRCMPYNQDRTSFRTPTPEEVAKCCMYVEADILKTRPKLIMPLGAVAAQHFLKDQFTSITKVRGQLFEIEIRGVKFPVLPTFHPSYIRRNSGNPVLGSEFLSDLAKAKAFVSRPQSSESLTSSSVLDKKICTLTTYAEFDQFCKDYLDHADTIAYDIETNGGHPLAVGSEVIGFSLASDPHVSCYVVLNSLDYTMPREDRVRVEGRLRDLLLAKHLLIHNCSYEIPYTLNWLGVEIDRDIDDTMVKARVLQTGLSVSLKTQAVTHLRYPSWNSHIEAYSTAYQELLSYATKVLKKPSSEADSIKSFESLDSWKALYPEPDKNTSKVTNNIDKIKSILEVYYSDEELPGVEKLILQDLRLRATSEMGSDFRSVPFRVIAKYGGYDALATYELNSYYDQEMAKLSESLRINLREGYITCLKQAKAGTWLEINGMHWNDKVASDAYNYYTNLSIRSLKNLIESPLMKDWVTKPGVSEISRYLESRGPQSLPNGQVLVRKSKHRVLLDNKDPIPDDFSSRPEYREFFEGVYYNGLMKEVEESNDLEFLKSIFNPMSTVKSTTSFIASILISEDFKIARFYQNLVTITQSPDFSADKFPQPDGGLLASIVRLEKLVDSKELSRSQVFEKFKRYLSTKPTFMSPEVQRALGDAANYSVDSADEDTVVNVYRVYTLMGMDADDESTWDDRFRWLYNYRMFKKSQKLISVYLEGRVGRPNVYVVNRRDLESGKSLVRREAPYTPNISSESAYIMQTDFNVGGTNTGRWSSGIHTIPWGSVIKNIYTSRYPGGVIAAPDFSQQELRVLAAASGDPSLLEEFKRGGDIHRFVASKIYAKDPEKVTEVERRFAKMASFSIVYGAEEHSFARTYLNGDIERAKFIYQSMFKSFPGVKKYIEDKHKQAQEMGLVTLLTNRFIRIPVPSRDDRGAFEAAMRDAQNWPIQGASSDIGGEVLYEIIHYVRTHNFKTKPICFIHDSLEIDIHPDELFIVCKLIVDLMNKYPLEKWGTPCKASLVIGPSMGQEIEVEEIESDPEGIEGYLVLNGFKDDMNSVFEAWEKVYRRVEISPILDESGKPIVKEVYTPRSESFTPKKSVSWYDGQVREEAKVKVEISRV